MLLIAARILTSSDDQLQFFNDSSDTSDTLSLSASHKPLQKAASASVSSSSCGGAGRPDKTPVFQSEEDRLMFDHSLAVDIAPLVSGMYRQQSIEPGGGGVRRPAMNLFTCMTCSKVFTSLSRCQLHCLIHTAARPFHCPWCSYSTNIRG